MSDDDVCAVQLHPDGPSCDSVNHAVVPIVFVPGVMGSRIRMPSVGRAWNPEGGLDMGKWAPLNKAQRQTNRRALSPNKSAAKTFDALGSDAVKEIEKNDALANIFAMAVGDGSNPVQAPDGTTLTNPAIEDYYGKARNWGSVTWPFYGAVLQFLEQTHNASLEHPVYAFGYDWRQSNQDSGNALATFISGVLNVNGSAQDVVIVTHSMGGLVLRGALNGSSAVASQIRGVIHGAQPSTGAVVCYRRFIIGAVNELDGGTFFSLKKKDLVAAFLNQLMGPSGPEFAYNLAGCPGPMELLPTQVYQSSQPDGTPPWLTVDGQSIDLGDIYTAYNQYGWPGLVGPADAAQLSVATPRELDENAIVNDIQSSIASAKAFHGAIVNTAHANTFAVYSDGLTTDLGMQFSAYPALSQGWVQPQFFVNSAPEGANGVVIMRDSGGDGTVPTVSAQCPAMTLSAPAMQGCSVEHAAVYSDSGFQQVVSTFVSKLFATPPGSSVRP